ncbi:MAG: cation:proton antiporter [Thermodesulfobacteriota bacterium]|nr:cation:proton antiporter [Thermodesulfobacteriota bacterium]
MGIPLLNNIVIIFGLSIFVLFVCNRLRVPPIIGFFLTGIFVGPYGLGLVKVVHEVEILAEIGVVLLLFAIGIEFSLERLLQIKKSVLMGGSLQVLLTFLATAFIVRFLGQAYGNAVFIGFLVALSSTAIVLRLIQERAEVDSPHGRTILGILIFQDIIVIPMMLITPLLVGAEGKLGSSFLIMAAKGISIILLVIVTTKWIAPWVLFQIARTRNQEIFLLSIVVICFGVAWLSFKAGLSLALGAFLAGLIISETEYSHQALGNILPFRDVFTTFFFISIGMMLDVGFVFQKPVIILISALSVLVVKTFIAGLVTILLGLPLRTGILVGLALSQIGEFSFILSRAGIQHGLLSENIYQMFLAVSVLTMAATPFILMLSPRIADMILRLPMPKRIISGIHPVTDIDVEDKANHLVIIGFGVNGRNVARAAKIAGIPYTIIEMNPETVQREKAKGEPIHYGDATWEAVLHIVNIQEVRIVVIAINDPTATRRITEVIRRITPKAHLIVRTRYLQEMKPLYELGADDVIPEEFETSVEIFTRVLMKYLIPRDEIERLITEVRADGYEMFRSLSQRSHSFSDLKQYMHDVDISTIRISEESQLIGKTLAQTELRSRCGVSVVAIQRDSQILSNPGADVIIRLGDVLFVLGSFENISEAFCMLSHPSERSEGP